MLTKTNIIFGLIFLATISVSAQVFTGTVLNAETKNPIAYANIYFVEL